MGAQSGGESWLRLRQVAFAWMGLVTLQSMPAATHFVLKFLCVHYIHSLMISNETDFMAI